MVSLIALGFGTMAVFVDASSLVAAEVIRAGDGVTVANAELKDGDGPEVYDLFEGREVRRTVYAGQTITLENTQPARLVTRNQIVTIKFIKGPLEISTSGRAMGDGALNENVNVLNLQSRQMVQGIVQADGWVLAQ
ncbi:MAG: flagellar basal body P-ring formation protein FlgA [Hyphomonas sp.]|uniref:flagellar basal body P-ring formation chaperone FlgA n=1 Tax=Hyphomonas sp. TaxID=87 RepID=UPI0017FCE0B5|nr:flagellar basal body P-ring formation chaperone FlgA [Hyphomonas sp.]MBA3067878.1 flagellar basal body P-ring formation protein FlgA [Hyphomonas sp.]MBU3921607.1 flagellar basal body P-ring formation chaperone FlgA [Alphaproteobacteria bacterium]MBU4062434.1 flagellar basal body P-ring formation chaperone FlgA [Alphaproteobacteria bacterium]MBU4165957.1 flagellar basal body P-ring formation chaperone FlgA [Alphaproteobacteria bacterium]